MASYGVFLYIFAQSFHLSMIFSKAFQEVEELSMGLIDKNRELESLHTIDLAIASSVDRDSVLSVILEQAVARLGMDAADVLLLTSGAIPVLRRAHAASAPTPSCTRGSSRARASPAAPCRATRPSSSRIWTRTSRASPARPPSPPRDSSSTRAGG